MADKNFKVRHGLDVDGDATLTGDLAVQGNDIKSSTGATAITLSGADIAVAGDLTVIGNDIKSSSATAITMSGADVAVAGDLTVTGNDIKSSSATAITMSGADVSVAGDLTVTGNDIKSSSATAITMSGTNIAVAGDLTVTGGQINSSTALALSLSGGDVVVAGDLTVFGNDIKSSGATAITLSGTNVAVAGDLTVTGNDIKSSGGTTAITLSGADVAVAGDLTVTGNDIKSSGGTTAITLSGADVTIAGDLTVSGTTTTLDTQNLLVEDNIILLNKNESGAGITAGSAGIEIERGSLANVQIRFDESTDRWQTTTDGSTYIDVPNQDLDTNANPSFAGVTAGNIQVGVTGDNEIDTSSGNLTIDSAGGTVTIDDDVTVSGDIRINGDDIRNSLGNSVIQFSGTSDADINGNLFVDLDLQVSGNNINMAGGQSALTFSGTGDVEVTGDLKVSGNDIKSSSGSTAITLSGENITVAGNVNADNLRLTYVNSTYPTDVMIQTYNYGSNFTANLQPWKARGTSGSPTTIQNGDAVFKLEAINYTGTWDGYTGSVGTENGWSFGGQLNYINTTDTAVDDQQAVAQYGYSTTTGYWNILTQAKTNSDVPSNVQHSTQMRVEGDEIKFINTDIGSFFAPIASVPRIVAVDASNNNYTYRFKPNGYFKPHTGLETDNFKNSSGTTAMTLTGTNLELVGDLTVTGNDIKSSGGTTAITMSSADVTIAGDLTVTGNDIKSSSATAITMSGADVAIAGDLTVTGNDIKSSTATAITLSGDDVTVVGDLNSNYINNIQPSNGFGIKNSFFDSRDVGNTEANLTFFSARGSSSSPTAVQSGDVNTKVESQVYTGLNWSGTSGNGGSGYSYTGQLYNEQTTNVGTDSPAPFAQYGYSVVKSNWNIFMTNTPDSDSTASGWNNSTIQLNGEKIKFTAFNQDTFFAQVATNPKIIATTSGGTEVPFKFLSTGDFQPSAGIKSSSANLLLKNNSASTIADISRTGSTFNGTSWNFQDTAAAGSSFSVFTPSAVGDIIGSFNAYSSDGSASPTFIFAHARGTASSPSATQNGDLIGEFKVNGYGTSAGGIAGGIRYEATENWTNSAWGSVLRFNAVKATTTTSTSVFESNVTNTYIRGDTLNLQNSAGTALTSAGINYTRTYGEFAYTNAAGFAIAAQNTIYAMPLDTTLNNSGVTISNTSRININVSGWYKIIMSLQITLTVSNQPGQIDFWLRKNGVDVANSKTQVDLLKDQKSVIAMDWLVESDGNDYWEIVYVGTTANYADIDFPTIAATTTPYVSPVAPALLVNVIPAGA